jgi:hypothetical protein
MADQKGFLDAIGVGAQDEGALRRQAMLDQQTRGTGFAAQQARLGAQASPLVHGATRAVEGLLTGANDGRSVGGFAQNLGAGIAGRTDEQDAQASGITVDALRARREIRNATADFKDDGTFESRINMANKVAAIANKHGQLDIVSNALRQAAEIEKEKFEFTQLGVETGKAVRDFESEKELGFEARSVSDDEKVKGKAVRINDGPDAGKYLLIRPGKPDEVVRGGDLIAPGLTGVKPKKVLAQDTLQGLVRANGALPGQIVKMRGQMSSMAENATIVDNISDNLLSANDPQGILATSGRAAINADKTISFAESVSSTLSDPRLPSSRTTWNGEKKFVSPEKQHELATDQSLLDSFLATVGITDRTEALPPNIRGNAIAAEQYWANVMELAYLDARLMEPSNRGLSDNDIKNALKRIGADTANPLSFARRQLEVIDTKLLPQLSNLGSDFTNFDSDIYTSEDVANAVYDPEKRAEVRSTILQTRSKLVAVLEQGRRGDENTVAGAPTRSPETVDLGDDDLAAEIARLEAEQAGAQ